MARSMSFIGVLVPPDGQIYDGSLFCIKYTALLYIYIYTVLFDFCTDRRFFKRVRIFVLLVFVNCFLR